MSGKDENEAKNTNIQIDVTSPCFLHASDNPGQVFVSEPLRDRNYGEWIMDMTNALYAKNKIGFVDGTITMPGIDSNNLGHWMRCNAMVKGWLKSSMDKDIRNSVRYASTARGIWVDLGERFAKESAPRIYELRRAISMLRQERSTVPLYFTKLKGLWDEMQSMTPWPRCSCGSCKCDIHKRLTDMREQEKMYDFLMGLDESFNTVKTQILSVTPNMSLSHAYHLVVEDEQQLAISSVQKTHIEGVAFQTSNTKDKEVKKDRPTCEHCGKEGHVKDGCWDIIGYPPNWKTTNFFL